MANFAALIDTLSISGSRLTDGTANASGKVYFFQPGTNTTVQVYSDAAATTVVTQPITLGAGGKLPSNLSGGVFATQPVRILIQTSDGATTVTDNTWIPATAGDVGVDNDGFTDSTLDGVLDKAFTSFGGQDFLYKESGGATSREINDKFREQGIWVTDFPDVDPTGVNVSTTGIQAAMSRAKVLSCPLFFPPGSFKTDAALTLTSATGVQIVGAGHGATTITPTNATENAFTFSSCTGCGVHGLQILHTAGSTGAAISASACLNFSASDLFIPANATYAGFDYGMDFSGNGTIDFLSNCYHINANTVALRIGISGTVQSQLISNCQIGASSAAPVSPTSGIEFTAAGGTFYFFGNGIVGATNNVLFTAMPSVKFLGNANDVVLGSVQYSGATAALFPQLGNGVYGYTEDLASGGTFTPNLLKGNHIRVRVSSTGAAYTIAAATPAPAASQYGVWFMLDIFNNAGGNVTAGSAFAAAYHVGGAGGQPSLIDLEYTSYIFHWDASASVWRMNSREVTT